MDSSFCACASCTSSNCRSLVSRMKMVRNVPSCVFHCREGQLHGELRAIAASSGQLDSLPLPAQPMPAAAARQFVA